MAPRPTELGAGLDEGLHQQMVNHKLNHFSWENPLGISVVLHYVLAIYGPVLVLLGVGLNLFAEWAMQSTFLLDLPVQPLLATLLRLNCVTLLAGPFYVWLVQIADFHISRIQIFQCFLLNVMHNFALLATAFVVVALVLERGLVIGRPKSEWPSRRRRLSRLTRIFLLIAAFLSLVEIYSLDLYSLTSDNQYPICLPWWENEHVSPIWYKSLACIFSLGPVLLIIIGVLALELCVARFNLTRRLGQESLPDYQAMLLELTTAIHLKFVNSASCLGIAFLFLCCPVGLFIMLGPALHVRASEALTHYNSMASDIPTNASSYAQAIMLQSQQQYGALTTSASNLPSLISNSSNGSDLGIAWNTTGYSGESARSEAEPDVRVLARETSKQRLNALLYSYTLVSRGDAETVVWLMRYTFCLVVVPLLLVTEILFYREWRGRMRQVSEVLCCRWMRNNSSRYSREARAEAVWKSNPGPNPDATVNPPDSVAGPYIARVDEDDGRRASSGKHRDIKIYDASKPARAGRNIDNLPARSTPRTNQQPPAAQTTPKTSSYETKTDTDAKVAPSSKPPGVFLRIFRKLFGRSSSERPGGGGSSTSVDVPGHRTNGKVLRNRAGEVSSGGGGMRRVSAGSLSDSDTSSTWNAAPVLPARSFTKMAVMGSTQHRLAKEAAAVGAATSVKGSATRQRMMKEREATRAAPVDMDGAQEQQLAKEVVVREAGIAVMCSSDTQQQLAKEAVAVRLAASVMGSATGQRLAKEVAGTGVAAVVTTAATVGKAIVLSSVAQAPASPPVFIKSTPGDIPAGRRTVKALPVKSVPATSSSTMAHPVGGMNLPVNFSRDVVALGQTAYKALSSTPKSAPAFTIVDAGSVAINVWQQPAGGGNVAGSKDAPGTPDRPVVDFQLLAQLAAVDARRRDFMNHGGSTPGGGPVTRLSARSTAPPPVMSTSDTTVLPIAGRGKIGAWKGK